MVVKSLRIGAANNYGAVSACLFATKTEARTFLRTVSFVPQQLQLYINQCNDKKEWQTSR